MWAENLMEDLKNNRAQFKLKLQSGNAQFWSKLVIFLPPVTSKFEMTLKNNRVNLLSCFKPRHHLIAIYQFKMELQSGNAKFGSKSAIFFHVTLKFDIWPWKTIGHFFYAPSTIMYHFTALCEIKIKLQSGNTKFGSKSAIFCPVCPWNLTDDLEKQ